jgi:hypothetical protein
MVPGRKCCRVHSRLQRAFKAIVETFKELAGNRAGLRHWMLIALLCWVATLLVEWRLFRTPGVLLGSNTDAVSTHYPLRDYIHLWVQRGVIPLWNPHYFNGLPVQAGLRPVINPALILTWLTPDVQSEMRLIVFCHLFLTHFGATLWLRSWRFSLLSSWFGGMAIAYTGFQLAHLFAGHYDILINLPWVLWLLWAARLALTRSGVAYSALATLMLLLVLSCGHYHVVYLSCWYLGVEFLLCSLLGTWGRVPPWNFRRPWARGQLEVEEQRRHWGSAGRGLLRLAAIVGTAVAFNAYQFLPALETAANSIRGQVDYDYAIQFGAPPVAWLTMFIPHLFQGTFEISAWAPWVVWEGHAYVGITTLLVIGVGLGQSRSKVWQGHALLLILAQWLALGDFGGLFKLYYALDPAVGAFRVPSRFLWPATIATGWLAAYGFQVMLSCGFQLSKRTWAALQSVLALALLFWTLVFYQDGNAGWWEGFVRFTLRQAEGGAAPENLNSLLGLTWVRLSGSVLVVGCFTYAMGRMPISSRAGLVSILLALELAAFSYPYQQIADVQSLWLSPEVLAFMQEHPTVDRYCSDPALSWQNHLAAYDRSEPNGYDNIMSMTYARQVLKDYGMAPGTLITVYDRALPSRLHRLQSVRYYFGTKDYLNDANQPDAHLFEGFDQISISDSPVKFYKDPRALPRFYFVTGARAMDRPAASLDELDRDWQRTSSNANFEATVLKEVQRFSRAHGFELKPAVLPAMTDQVVLQNPVISANEATVECVNRVPGVLIMTDNPWPGWKVTVDGFDWPLFPSEADLHRAVVLPAGAHKVRFYFWPDSLSTGIRMAQQALAGVLVWFILGWLIQWKWPGSFGDDTAQD